MKRNLIGTLSLVAMSLLLNVNGAYAQSAVKANVPFPFNVGTSQLPAGSYSITREDGLGLFMIGNSTTGARIHSLGQPEYSRDRSWKLVFQRLGNRYFLTQIWGEQGSTGLRLRAPKPETKLEIASQPSPSRKEVEIALK